MSADWPEPRPPTLGQRASPAATTTDKEANPSGPGTDIALDAGPGRQERSISLQKNILPYKNARVQNTVPGSLVRRPVGTDETCWVLSQWLASRRLSGRMSLLREAGVANYWSLMKVKAKGECLAWQSLHSDRFIVTSQSFIEYDGFPLAILLANDLFI